MITLPDFLKEFLFLGETKITPEIKPNWLLDSFDAPIWHIKIPGESRFFDQKWMGTPKLDWRLRVSGGYLTDECWSILLQHCKLMVIAHIEGPDANTSSPFGLVNFQREIINLAEHLIFHYPNEISLFGLYNLSLDKVEQYLIDHLRFGSYGTGCWFSRLEHYLLSKIKDPIVQNKVSNWVNCQPTKIIEEIDNLHRNIITNNSLEIKSIPDTKLSCKDLIFSRRWLLMHAWYNKNGCVNLKYLADIIEVDLNRLANSACLKYYLRPLELCQDYRQNELKWSYRECLGHRYRSIAQKSLDNISPVDQLIAYRLFEKLQRYSVNINLLQNSVLSSLDLTKIPFSLRGGNGSRTPTLPISTAMYLYDKLIHWAQQYAKPLMLYYSDILNFVINNQGNAIRHCRKKYDNNDRSKTYSCIWEKAFLIIPPPPELNDLNFWRVASIADRRSENFGMRIENGGSKIPSILRNKGLTLVDAMKLNVAVLIGLVAAFSLRRRNEITSLKLTCLIEKAGKFYLGFNLEKVCYDGVRPLIYRPIPEFLYNVLQAQKKLATNLVLAEKYRQNDPTLHDRLFIIPTNTGGRVINKIELSTYIDLFCDWIEVPLNKYGRRWYLRIHECRRFGAMSFFHLSGMQSSLPALAWFMGHRDIKKTWRYIQEELSGQELTQCEVAMAHAALLNQQEIGNLNGSQDLANFVFKYFGVNRIDLIDPNELDEYLEILYREGVYRATPHSIQFENEKRYSILIEIIKEI